MTFMQKATPSIGFKEPDEGSKDAGASFQPAWANIAYEVYVAIMGLRNASETIEQRLSRFKRVQPAAYIFFLCVHPSWEVSWPAGTVLWSTTSACASVPGSCRLGHGLMVWAAFATTNPRSRP
jgi:hypothetical protein